MAFLTLYPGMSGDLWQAHYDFGAFNDTVYVAASDAYVIKTYGGSDIVWMTGNTNPAFLPIVFLGSGDDVLMGSDGREDVFDGSGADHIYLGGGNDVMHVGVGADVYDGGAGNDDVLSFVSASYDGFGFIEDSIDGAALDLAISGWQLVGNWGPKVVLNFERICGGGASDRFFGNAGSNGFWGNGGHDYIDGRAGNDHLTGGAGADTLIGGLGQDFIWCATPSLFHDAPDVIRYQNFADSAPDMMLADRIFEFDAGGTLSDDRIDLSPLDGNLTIAGNQNLIWRGAGAFSTSAAGEVRIAPLPGQPGVIIYIDNDADTAAEMAILVMNVTTLTTSDIIL